MRKSNQISLSSIIVILFLLLITSIVIPVTDEQPLLDSSFSVEPGDEYGPYDDGTVCHPKILGYSTLRCVVDLVNGGIFLTVSGHYTEELQNIFISQTLSFVIIDAHEQYTFMFSNTANGTEVIVHLTVIEVWTRPIAFLSPLASYMTFGCGVILLIAITMTFYKRLRSRNIK